MAFKTITIKESVYNELFNFKYPSESFSELFERFLHKKKLDVHRFYGAWKLTKKKSAKIDSELKKMRVEAERGFKRRTNESS
ncbi:MAG: hypothetical protein J4432_05225 [DPANN group archaeon]|nr:hypothetical protein [DPANN group archaeon]